MKSRKAKIKIFILLLVVASAAYVIVASTGLVVEKETHVLVDDDLNSASKKVDVNQEKLYELRKKIENQIHQDQELIENKFDEFSGNSKSEFEKEVKLLSGELDKAREEILELNEEELKDLYAKLKSKHDKLLKRLKKNE